MFNIFFFPYYDSGSSDAMRPQWLQAFVLHRRPYRETSYIVDFFTYELGKISAVAKGIRNSRSERKSLLQLFQPLKIQLYGKGELKNLSHVESDGFSIPLAGQHLFCGMYVNELTNRLMPQGLASDVLFDSYKQTLTLLNSTNDMEIILRLFEFSLLEEMGMQADWNTDATTGMPVSAQRWYRYLPEQGLVQVDKPIAGAAVPGQALLEIAQQQWTENAKKAAKIINRQALHTLLGDKPLKSRELFSTFAQ